MGVAQITRVTSQNLDASLCNERIFSDSSIYRRVRCEGSHCLRSPTQINRLACESRAGIGCSHSFDDVHARAAPRSRADRSGQFPLPRICRKALCCRNNLNRMRCRRCVVVEPKRIESCVAAIDARFLAGLTRPRGRVSRCKIAAQRRIRGAKRPGASLRGGYGVSVAFWTRFCRPWKAVRHPHFGPDKSFLSVACG